MQSCFIGTAIPVHFKKKTSWGFFPLKRLCFTKKLLTRGSEYVQNTDIF